MVPFGVLSRVRRDHSGKSLCSWKTRWVETASAVSSSVSATGFLSFGLCWWVGLGGFSDLGAFASFRNSPEPGFVGRIWLVGTQRCQFPSVTCLQHIRPVLSRVPASSLILRDDLEKPVFSHFVDAVTRAQSGLAILPRSHARGGIRNQGMSKIRGAGAPPRAS